MLSEKWIAEAIENEMAKVLFSDDPADWDWRAVALTAAHAIAEAMKGKVIWEGPAVYGGHAAIRLVSPVSGEQYGLFMPWPQDGFEKLPIGQQLKVTVTVKEE